MMKRIASAFLALLILISALPIGAAAEEIGQTVELPAKQDPGNGWEPDRDDWVQRGCDLEGHVHDQSCVSEQNTLICDPPPGTHIHDQSCGYYDITYQWVYTGNSVRAAASVKIDGGLTIHNVDSLGNPIAGSKFFLYNPETRQSSTQATTDDNGNAVISSVRMDEDATSTTWTLNQIFDKNLYQKSNPQYEVIIKKDRGVYIPSIPGADASVYDAENQILTVVNQTLKGTLVVKLDVKGSTDPRDSYNVIVTGPNDYRAEETLPRQIDGGITWDLVLRELELGEYTVALADAGAEGYHMETSTQVEWPLTGETSESDKAELTKEKSAAIITITNKYTKILPKKVEIRTQDTDGNLLGGATVKIDVGGKPLPLSDGNADFDEDPREGIIALNLANYIGLLEAEIENGENMTAVLSQTEAPEYYTTSTDTYSLYVEKTAGGDILYDVVGVPPVGDTWYLNFTHPAQYATLKVTADALFTPEDAAVTDKEVTIKAISSTNTFTGTCKLGESVELQVPLGSYTIIQEDATIPGFVHAAEYDNQDLTVKKAGGRASCTITNTYEKINNPANTIHVKALDDSSNEMQGVEFTLSEDKKGETVVDTYSSGSFMIANLEDKAASGKTVTYYLQQTKAPRGFRMSEDRYKIEISTSGQDITVEAEKDENFLVSLFSAGLEKDENGQYITFVNEELLGDLTITMETKGEKALDKIPVTVTGPNVNETIEFTADKTTETLENVRMAEYTITQQAEASGFDLTTTMEAKGGTITEGVLTIDEDETKPSVTITNTYEESKEPLLNTLTILMKDDMGNPLPGGSIALWYGENPLSQFGIGPFKDRDDGAEDGKIVIDNVKSLVDAVGEQYGGLLNTLGGIKLTLKQDARPEGVDKDTVTPAYTIEVKKNLDYSILGVTPVNGGAEIALVYPADKGTLHLTVEMKNAPADINELTFTADNDPTDDTNILYTVRVTKNAAGVWEATEELPVGYYTIASASPAPEGYRVKVTYEPKHGKANVMKDDTCEFKVINEYTKRVTAAGESDQVIIWTVSADGKMLSGVKYGLYDKNGVLLKEYQDAWNETQGANMTLMGDLPTDAVLLKQISTEDGYKISSETYDISIVPRPDGTRSMVVTADNVYETPIGQSIYINGDGDLIMTFVNEKVTETPGTVTKPEEDVEDVKADPNGKMIIRTVDERGQLWGGARYGLFYGSTEIRSFTDYGTGKIVIEDSSKLLENTDVLLDAPMTLKQTKAPNTAEGLSDKVYSVIKKLVDGKVMLYVEGSELDSKGVQIVEFRNQHPAKAQEPEPVNKTDESNTIVIRTLDDAGNILSGAEYCLSEDQYYDKDEDVLYSEADRHGEIVIKDLSKLVENGEKDTYYLMQSRQPNDSKLSTDRFKVELSKKNGKLDVIVNKDQSLFDAKSNGTVEEGDDGEWIVTFVSNQRTTTVNVTCNELVNWNDCVIVEDVLSSYKQSEYEFIMNWEHNGQKQEPKSLKLRSGETGSFEPIPNGARYEVQIPEDICAKGVFRKGQRIGTADTETVELEAELTYNIVKGDPLTIDMVRIDAQTEEPLAGAVYTLKDENGEEVDTYKTRSDGRLLVDAITAPGEYTLAETETPDGYSKIKKDIAINAALAFEEGTDAKGNPVIRQMLKADVTHSMVKQLESGTYRIGTAQGGEKNNTVVIAAAAVGAVAAAGGAGALLLKRRRKARRSSF